MTLKEIASLALVEDAATSQSGASSAAPLTDLQKHDAKYHPNGYKQGDACKYRDNLNKGNKADQLDPENVDGDTDVGGVLTGKSFAATIGKLAPLMKLLGTMPAGSMAAKMMKKQIADMLGGKGKIVASPKSSAVPPATQSSVPAPGASSTPQPLAGWQKALNQIQGKNKTLGTAYGTIANWIGGTGTSAQTPTPPQTQAAPPPSSAPATAQNPQQSTPQPTATAQPQQPPPPPKPRKPRKPRKPKGLDLGQKSLVQDGDDGATINRKRKAAGLKPLQILDTIDAKVNACTKNYQAATAQLAANFGDPDLDISSPAVFDTVQKNWAATVKRLVSESKVITATKAHRLLDILNAKMFKTKYISDSLKQERYDVLLGLKRGTSAEVQASAEEAPLSATLCSPDSARMFENKAFGPFGIIGVEWKKDSNNYVMAFSNCDIGTPGDLETYGGAGGYGRNYNPTLVSNPSITSLAAFDNGTDSGDFRLARRLSKTGEMTPSGKYMSSYCATLKLLRKGELKGDALDFDNAVNRADMSPWRKKNSPPRAWGWNEILLCGKAGIQDIGAIHFNTKAWAKQFADEEKQIADGVWRSGESRPTQGEKDANVYIQKLVQSHGQFLKQNGIKIIVDGKEMHF